MRRGRKPSPTDPFQQQLLKMARQWRHRAAVIRAQVARQRKPAADLVALTEVHRLTALAEAYRACATQLEAAVDSTSGDGQADAIGRQNPVAE